jgi:glycerophosphoryl diester phosphodiesterase
MTEIIAHRGGALLWPENSRTAITNAVRLGVDQVQVDVHPTRDGRIAVIHDATLERTTDGVGAVAARSWAELSALTLQGTKDEGIPSLGEVVDLLRPSRATLRIEIKADVAKQIYPGFSALLAAFLQDIGFVNRTIVTGFQLAALEEFVAHATPLSHVWLISNDSFATLGLEGVLATARAHSISALGLRWNSLDAASVARIRGDGFALGCFGCNDEASILQMLPHGLDELMTDRPDIAARHLRVCPS